MRSVALLALIVALIVVASIVMIPELVKMGGDCTLLRMGCAP